MEENKSGLLGGNVDIKNRFSLDTPTSQLLASIIYLCVLNVISVWHSDRSDVTLPALATTPPTVPNKWLFTAAIAVRQEKSAIF